MVIFKVSSTAEHSLCTAGELLQIARSVSSQAMRFRNARFNSFFCLKLVNLLALITLPLSFLVTIVRNSLKSMFFFYSASVTPLVMNSIISKKL